MLVFDSIIIKWVPHMWTLPKGNPRTSGTEFYDNQVDNIALFSYFIICIFNFCINCYSISEIPVSLFFFNFWLFRSSMLTVFFISLAVLYFSFFFYIALGVENENLCRQIHLYWGASLIKLLVVWRKLCFRFTTVYRFIKDVGTQCQWHLTYKSQFGHDIFSCILLIK